MDGELVHRAERGLAISLSKLTNGVVGSERSTFAASRAADARRERIGGLVKKAGYESDSRMLWTDLLDAGVRKSFCQSRAGRLTGSGTPTQSSAPAGVPIRNKKRSTTMLGADREFRVPVRRVRSKTLDDAFVGNTASPAARQPNVCMHRALEIGYRIARTPRKCVLGQRLRNKSPR